MISLVKTYLKVHLCHDCHDCLSFGTRDFSRTTDQRICWSGGPADWFPLLSGTISSAQRYQCLKNLPADWFGEQVSDVQFGLDPTDVHEAQLHGLLVEMVCLIDVLISRADEVFQAQPIGLSIVSEDNARCLEDLRGDSELLQQLTEPDEPLHSSGNAHVLIVFRAESHVLELLTLSCDRSSEPRNHEACLCEPICGVRLVACI
jgi:hypothetical protein